MKLTVIKQKNKDRWEIPYSYAGRCSSVHITKDEHGYFIYKGACGIIASSFEDAVKIATALAKRA